MRSGKLHFEAALLTLALGLISCSKEVVRFDGNDFSSDPPKPAPLLGALLVANSGDDTLSAIDPVKRTPLAKIPVGFIPVEREGPHDVVPAPDGLTIFVTLNEAVAGSGTGPHGAHGTGTAPGFLLKLSVTDGSLLGFVSIDPNPAEIAVSPDSSTVYVTHYGLSKWVQAAQMGDPSKGYSNMAVVDAASMTLKKSVPVCPAPHGIELSEDGKTAFIACAADEIAVVQVDDPSFPVMRVPVVAGATEGGDCEHCPYRLTVAPDNTVWVANLGPGSGQGRGEVRVFDPVTHTFDPARTIRACGHITAVEFLPRGSSYQVYLAEQGTCGDAIDVFDAGATGTVSRSLGQIALSLPDCQAANDLSLAEDGKSGWVSCEGNHTGPGSVVFFDPLTLTVQGAVPTGVFPTEMGSVPSQSAR